MERFAALFKLVTIKFLKIFSLRIELYSFHLVRIILHVSFFIWLAISNCLRRPYRRRSSVCYYRFCYLCLISLWALQSGLLNGDVWIKSRPQTFLRRYLIKFPNWIYKWMEMSIFRTISIKVLRSDLWVYKCASIWKKYSNLSPFYFPSRVSI